MNAHETKEGDGAPPRTSGDVSTGESPEHTPMDTPMGDSGDEAMEEAVKKTKKQLAIEAREIKQEKREIWLKNTTRIEQDRQRLLKSIKRDRMKRNEFLLRQTNIFSHFVDIEKVKDQLNEDQLSMARAEKTADSSTGVPKSPSKRRRAGEGEEDSKMIEADSHGHKVQTHFTESPSYIEGGTMRDYQVRGLNWMVALFENGVSGILADEMGLGKTLQTISILGYLKEHRNINGPHLLIVPKSTMQNWIREVGRWCPSLRSIFLQGTPEERAAICEDKILGEGWDVLVTSYEICIKEKNTLKKIGWQYIGIDEAHRIKNEHGKLSGVVREFTSRCRLLITGTPLQNNLHELWALLNFLLPDIFSDSEQFDSWFGLGDEASEERKQEVVTRLHKVLRPFLLRRIKKEVEKGLPPKKETNVMVGLSTMQHDWYKKILMKDMTLIAGVTSKGDNPRMRLLNILMQLRKCTNHPYLFDGAEPGPPYTTDTHLVENCGKMHVLHKLLVKLKQQGSRVLIFSQMTRMLDILEDYMLWQGHGYCRLDGQTSYEERQQSIDSYNAPNSEKFAFLLSTRAGGLGINLATADTVIMYDSDWNPQVDLQAVDRAHRIGQKKKVRVFRLITQHTVEEKIIQRATVKLKLDAMVIQQGRLQESQKKMAKDDMLNMIQFGADKIFSKKESTITDDDIDEILKYGEEKTEELNKELEDKGEEHLKSFAMDFNEETSGTIFKFEGEDYREKRAQNRTVSPFGSMVFKRERRERNYVADESIKNYLGESQKEKAPKVPRAPKQPKVEDHQFFPKRLNELLEIENLHYRRLTNYKIPKGDEETEEEAATREAEQRRIDDAVSLTEEEKEERDGLLDQGWNWSKREFQRFCAAAEKYGRQDHAAIAAEVETKSMAEVIEYAKVFWKRYTEISDHERIITKITKGEEKILRGEEIRNMLSTKVKSYKAPRQQLKLNYGPSRGKVYTEEEDRFLVCALNEIGFGEENVYDKMRDEIRFAPEFRFDWFIKSRTAQELSRRCTTLVSIIEREVEEKNKTKKRALDPSPKSHKKRKV